MKNRIIKASLLIFITAFALWMTEFILVNTMKDCKEETIGKINAVISHDLDVELTIWGASTALVNFNPNIIIDSLKISSMNMGIDGTNIDQYSGLLNEYIGYTNKSKYLVIALDIHGSLTNRKSFYHLHNWLHHLDNENIYDCLSDIDNKMMMKLKYIPFYSLIHYDKHSFPYFKRTLLNKKNEYQISNYGYHPHEVAPINASKDSSLMETSIDSRSFEKVKKAAIEANKKDIKCFIVITPCYEKGLSQIINRNDFVSKLKTLATERTEVLDFSNNYISKEPTYFKDNTHLNSNGADELTRLLITKIKKSN